MANLYDLIVNPFIDYGFMRKGLLAALFISASAAPIGVLLLLRRMSLVGDTLSHALLPGVALAFVWFGLSLWALTLGGLLAGLFIALAAGFISRHTRLKEDASFAALYLISIALGVTLVSLYGNSSDLLGFLFGNLLAISSSALLLIGLIASVTLLILAFIYRPLVMECFDRKFFSVISNNSALYHQLFLLLLVLNLVAAFQTLGTLLAVGIMMLPAVTARLIANTIPKLCLTAFVLAAIASVAGLLLSFYGDFPAGPTVILICGLEYALVIAWKSLRPRHAALAAVLLLVANPALAKPLVVTSFSVLTDMTRQIAGPHVIVVGLAGVDTDVHMFEPTPRDMKNLSNADLVIANGLGFEHWLPKLLRAVNYKGEVAEAGAGVHTLELDEGIDPHAWQDPQNGKIYIANIAEALSKLDPVHEPVFQKNAKAYQAQLNAADKELRQKFSKLPKNARTIITSHDAFQYFGHAFGLKFLAPQGINTASSPSAKEVAALIAQIKREKVKALFIENMSDPRLIEQISSETGARVGGTLYADALSGREGPASTYLDMLRYNGETIYTASAGF
ncbi:MAG: metal ABC transporter solute-binding protein, Zn/Mn family [Dongiaceae bacterium]